MMLKTVAMCCFLLPAICQSACVAGTDTCASTDDVSLLQMHMTKQTQTVKLEAAPAKISNFNPADGLICYEGPHDDMANLFQQVKVGSRQAIFANSTLFEGRCADRNYKLPVGPTCFGDTWASTYDLKPHIDAEAQSHDGFFFTHISQYINKTIVEPSCVTSFFEFMMHQDFSVPNGHLLNFSPEDGLICYEGPRMDIGKMYQQVKIGSRQAMFANSTLFVGKCASRKFNLSLGHTCYGDTFSNNADLKPHTDAEAQSHAAYVAVHGAAGIVEPSCVPSTFAVHPHADIVEAKKLEAVPAKISNFNPADGLICYEGTHDEMAKLFKEVKVGPRQAMFADSTLFEGRCADRHYAHPLGYTCYGNSFVTSYDLKPHMDAEAQSHASFLAAHGEAGIVEPSCVKTFHEFTLKKDLP